MAFIKVRKCFSEPKHFLRILAILVCMCIATYQLSGCISKILHPPTSTHNSFKLNQTLRYPSLTVCRNPGFKLEKFDKYGLTDVFLPSYTSFWKEFDFRNYSLDQFFADTTYSLEDIIPLHGFDGELQSLDIQEVLKLTYGKCFKFTPKLPSIRWEKTSGYCFYMKLTPHFKNITWSGVHLPATADSELNFLPEFQEQAKYGFHIFIHEPNERIADDGDQSTNFMAYVYVDSQSDLRYSLTASEYRNLPSRDNNCRREYNYSRTMCEELCLADLVINEVGCSAPWLESKTSYPRCTCYDKIKALISTYQVYSKRRSTLCNCPRSCNTTIYTPFMNEAKQLDYKLQSAFSLYYLSNLVTITEEIAVYDWSLFISDLGGSLGFLLGLSVLGIISMLQQILKMCLIVCKERKHVSSSTQPQVITPSTNAQRAVVLWKERTYFNFSDLYM